MCRQASDCDFEWRVATVMLNGESQVKDRESAMLNFIMAGYSSEGLSNHEQTRLMSWSTDGGLRGYHLARNPGLSFTTQHGAGAFPLSNEIPPPLKNADWSSLVRAQQTKGKYPDTTRLKKI